MAIYYEIARHMPGYPALPVILRTPPMRSIEAFRSKLGIASILKKNNPFVTLACPAASCGNYSPEDSRHFKPASYEA